MTPPTAEADESVKIPSRHRVDSSEGRRIAGRLRRVISGDPTPTAGEWNDMGEALVRGDPAGDRLAEWIERHRPSAFAAFERAIEQGIEAVPDAAPPLRDFFAILDRRPGWLNETLLAEGARVCQRSGASGLYALRDLALMGGYQSSDINRTLLMTGALARGAPRRLAETLKWQMECTEIGGMARLGDGFRSTLRVRLIHALVRRRLTAKPEWRPAEWGVPINQADMAATYLGFSVLFLLGARMLGVPFSRDESRAVMHLWRYICWVMGVEERWLVDDEAAGRRLLYQLSLTQMPDESSVQLGRALMDEPLHRHHPSLESLRRRYERHRHLSLNALFLGREGMRSLGLPATTLPWFPILNFAVVGVFQRGVQLLPGGRDYLRRAGRRSQVRSLRSVFGQQTDRIMAVEDAPRAAAIH